ncbi:Protein of unknown function (DUF2662), partial [Brevibacterium aurantiacum]
MGLLDRFEKGLENVVNGAFAKAFRSQVEPVELAGALRREADNKAAVVSRGRTLTANHYVIELSQTDHDRLSGLESELRSDLRQVVGNHAVEQAYTFVGPLSVEFAPADALDTGMYRVVSSTQRPDGSPAAQPANRGGYDPISRANPIVGESPNSGSRPATPRRTPGPARSAPPPAATSRPTTASRPAPAPPPPRSSEASVPLERGTPRPCRGQRPRFDERHASARTQTDNGDPVRRRCPPRRRGRGPLQRAGCPVSEFTVTVFRLAFFVILWLFVLGVAGVLRRDIFGPRK